METMSHEARELELYCDNTSELYRSRTVPIQQNLSKKYKAGKYDHEKAKKLWQYLAEDGAKRYAKEFAQANEWHSIFSVACRKECASSLADSWLAEMKCGNFHD
jgi:hypothetical protein